MRESDYDHLFRSLCKLQMEAPCHNGVCVGHLNCEYGVGGSYGEECAIEIVRQEADMKYKELRKRGGNN